jgi:hypothetical protein
MSTENKAVMTVDRVVEVTGLTRAAIYRVCERRALGVPGHYIYANGVVAFTFGGLFQLAEGLQEDAMMAAKALLFEIQQVRERAAAGAVPTPDDAEARRIAARWDRQFEAHEEDAA